MRTVLILLALTLLGLVSSAHALAFRILSWQGDISDLYYQDGRDTIEVRGYDDRLSRTYRYEGGGDLELFRIVETPEGEMRDVLLSIPIPPDADRLLFILHPSPDGKRIQRHRVIDDSFETIPLGHMHFYNFSSYAVILEFENDASTLASLPQGSKHLHPVAESTRSVPLRAATAEVQGQWQLFSTLPLPTRTTVRTLVILRDSRSRDARDAGVVEMTILQDTLRPPTQIDAE